MKAFWRQGDGLAASITRVALASNEASRAQTRDHFGHRRAVERNALTQRALVEVRLAVQRVQQSELWRSDRVGDLFIPQLVHDLNGATQQMAGMLHQVFRRMRVRRLFLHVSSLQPDNRQARGAAQGAPRWCPICLAAGRAQKASRSPCREAYGAPSR